MNEETKFFMKEAGILLLAGIIGGFIGGTIAKHNCCCMNHMHYHNGYMPFVQRFEHKRPKMEEFFTEENYIVIPKDFIEYMKKMEKLPKSFNGPRP